VPKSKVINIKEWRNRDTGQVLRYLTEQWENGLLDGLVLQSLDNRGAERTYFTGAYRRNPDRALSAGLKMSVYRTMLAGGFESN
jgi:hypothetical protein